MRDVTAIQNLLDLIDRNGTADEGFFGPYEEGLLAALHWVLRDKEAEDLEAEYADVEE